MCVGIQYVVFHLSDIVCINDPNGPFYDPFAEIIIISINHLMSHRLGFKAGQGPRLGSWVSRTLQWARCCSNIKTTSDDNSAIYTGSATIVDGKPIIVYPGKCIGTKGTPEGDACSTGFTYDVVVPPIRLIHYIQVDKTSI